MRIGGPLKSSIRTIGVALLLATLLSASCSPAPTPTPVPAPTATRAMEATVTPAATLQPLLSEEDRQTIQSAFAAMLVNPVKAVVFTAESGCDYCPTARQLVQELGSLSARISAEPYDLNHDSSLAAQYDVDKTPAIAIAGERDYGIRFYGLPYGREFSPLLQAIIIVSQGQSGLSAESIDALASLRTPLHIEVLVTPVCPYCPSVVSLAHKMALQSEYIRADAVESPEFPQLAEKYSVEVVPAIVINEKLVRTGQVDEAEFLQLVIAAAENQ